MKKNKLILLQLFVAFVLICTSVYATVSAKIDVTASKTSVDRGETISVVLSLKDVESSEKIQSIEGYINYDKNVIDEITVDSIEKSTDNTVKIGTETLKVEDLTNANANNVPNSNAYVAFNGKPTSDNDVKLVFDFNEGISTNVDLLTMKFKVKSDATVGDIEKAISYSMFVITNSNEKTEELTQNVKLTVKSPATDNDNTNNTAKNEASNNSASNTNNTSKNNTVNNTNTNKNTNTNNTNTNKNTNTNNTNKTNTNSNTDNTTAGKTLPATGAKVIIIPVVMLSILAYVCYNRYMKYKDI